MTIEPFRLAGRVRGLIFRFRAGGPMRFGCFLLTGSDVADYRGGPARFCEYCGQRASAFCEAHIKFICTGCVPRHQAQIATCDSSVLRCRYVSMSTYHKERTSAAPNLGEPNPLRDGWNEVK